MTELFIIEDNDITSIKTVPIPLTDCPENPETISEMNKVYKYMITKFINIFRELQQKLIKLKSSHFEFQSIKRNTFPIKNLKVNSWVQELDSCKSAEPGNDNNGTNMQDDYNCMGCCNHEKSASLGPDILHPLYMERMFNEEKCDSRNKIFNEIISNKPYKFSFKTLSFYTFGIIFFSFIITTPHSLIPASDLIKQPENWYEILFHGTYQPVWMSIFCCYHASSNLNIQYFQSKRFVASITLILVLTFLIILVVLYFLWTHVFSYNYPIPFQGFTLTFLFFVFQLLPMWTIIPPNWRNNSSFKKRFLYQLLYWIFTIVVVIAFNIIIDLIRRSRNEYQPILALTLPCLREVYERIATRIIRKSAEGDFPGATIVLKYTISGRYSIILCFIVGAIATNTTSWVLILVDSGINICYSLRIIWLCKHHHGMMHDQIETLQTLAIYELIEFQAPLSFMLVLGIAYYGPNGELYGNISNDYWTYSTIEDIREMMISMALFFLIDFASTIISAALLWEYCKINLWKVFLQLEEEFVKTFGIILGNLLLLVSASYI